MRDIRVCLVGDEGVGKSTLITSLIRETFIPLEKGTVLPDVTIPPEVAPAAGGEANMIIVDTSSAPSGAARLKNEVRKAHVIVIVYAVDDDASFQNVHEHWLPLIRSLGRAVPVVLAGNKLDLLEEQISDEMLAEGIRPIINEYKEVETCIECSARALVNVSEVFHFAENAVVNPTTPIYDSRIQMLKMTSISALTRIFELSDINKDGILDDGELNDFQMLCFNSPLQSHEIAGLKTLVSEYASDKAEPAVRHNGITLTGFLVLHTIFIRKGRVGMTWQVLRKFGYGDDLALREDFVHPHFDIPTDCTAELSPKGYQFFTDLFEAYDKDKDGALNAQELENIFSTTPGNPWSAEGLPDTTMSADENEDGAITLQGWLARWSMTTLLEPHVSLAYLAYLGYPFTSTHPSETLQTTSALQVTKPRRQERRRGKMSDRNVFLAYVLGAAGSGKTAILRNFADQPFTATYSPTTKKNTVVGTVELMGREKHLVLQEFGSTYEVEALRQSRRLHLADILVLVYDSADTNSFSYLNNLRQSVRGMDSIPTLFVATKSELDFAQQRHEVQPDVYCRKLGLRSPLAVSVAQGHLADLYHTICFIAANPYSSIPGGPEQNTQLQRALYLAGVIGAIGAVSIMLLRRTRD